MKIYIAYASDMDSESMLKRAPDSEFVDWGEIHGWRLEFRGDGIGFPTIAPSDSEIVPVAIWKITPEDESRLDCYAGFPSFCRKEEIEFQSESLGISRGMVYIIRSDRKFCVPGIYYFHALEEIYRENNFPIEILHSAFRRSCGKRFTLITREEESETIEIFCPRATIYGSGYLEVGGDFIPVRLWKIESSDEESLDRLYPHARKKIVTAEAVQTPDGSDLGFVRGLIYFRE